MLTKDNHVHKKGVTPIEALYLVAEHHRNAGGNPIVVEPGSEKNTGHFEDKVTEVDEDYVEVKTGTDGKVIKSVATHKVKKTSTVWVEDKPERTEDDEIARLRGKYIGAKLDAILLKVRNLPKTFEEAVKKGLELSLPSSSLTSHNLK